MADPPYGLSPESQVLLKCFRLCFGQLLVEFRRSQERVQDMLEQWDKALQGRLEEQAQRLERRLGHSEGRLGQAAEGVDRLAEAVAALLRGQAEAKALAAVPQQCGEMRESLRALLAAQQLMTQRLDGLVQKADSHRLDLLDLTHTNMAFWLTVGTTPHSASPGPAHTPAPSAASDPRDAPPAPPPDTPPHPPHGSLSVNSSLLSSSSWPRSLGNPRPAEDLPTGPQTGPPRGSTPLADLSAPPAPKAPPASGPAPASASLPANGTIYPSPTASAFEAPPSFAAPPPLPSAGPPSQAAPPVIKPTPRHPSVPPSPSTPQAPWAAPEGRSYAAGGPPPYGHGADPGPASFSVPAAFPHGSPTRYHPAELSQPPGPVGSERAHQHKDRSSKSQRPRHQTTPDGSRNSYYDPHLPRSGSFTYGRLSPTNDPSYGSDTQQLLHLSHANRPGSGEGRNHRTTQGPPPPHHRRTTDLGFPT